jgi:hypothetical protein
MMTKKLLSALVLLFLTYILSAQEDAPQPEKKLKHELGLNVTNLITDLLGNNNRSDPGTYLLSYKRLNGKTAFRLGLNVNFSLSQQRFGGFDNNLTNQNIQLRLGKEWRHDIIKRFQYYFGVDGLVGYQSEQSAATINGSTIIQKDGVLLLGMGPVLGFQFAIYEKLLIGTEGSLYATFNRTSTDFTTFGTIPIPNRSSNGVIIQTGLPKSLFLILKF